VPTATCVKAPSVFPVKLCNKVGKQTGRVRTLTNSHTRTWASKPDTVPVHAHPSAASSSSCAAAAAAPPRRRFRPPDPEATAAEEALAAPSPPPPTPAVLLRSGHRTASFPTVVYPRRFFVSVFSLPTASLQVGHVPFSRTHVVRQSLQYSCPCRRVGWHFSRYCAMEPPIWSTYRPPPPRPPRRARRRRRRRRRRTSRGWIKPCW
jgi:hypothetical protein